MAFKAETCVAHHIGDRKEQQDRVGLFAHPARSGVMLAVLADGMGGLRGGAIAAEQVVIKGKQNLEAFVPAEETPERLLGSVMEEAHTVIRLSRFTSEQEPHSTAVALLIQSDRATWAHCGDSRLYHFRGQGLLAVTPDHSLVGQLLREGSNNAAEALRHPKRNLLLSCLGGEREPVITFGRCADLVAGDSFLLCSDGLWAYFSDDELAAILARHSAREAAEMLVRLARERARGGGDNISLAIVKLVEPPRPRSF